MTTEPTLRRALGRPAAIAMVLGSVIGSGIFFKPQVVAAELGRFDLAIAVWIVAGVLCLLGALSLAELAAMLPRAGGLYVYLKEAYGDMVAFLYGWSLFVIVRPAATGSLATAFALSLDVPQSAKFAISIGAIAFLAAVNVAGVVWGGRMQGLTTVIKAGFLLVLALCPWVFGVADAANFTAVWDASAAGDAPRATAASFMVALLAVMFAYNSWHEVTPLAEEIVEPRRNVPFALIAGVSALIVLYVGANVAYHSVMPIHEVAGEQNSATALMDRVLGRGGETVMMVLVMCSVFGTLNANLLHAPRVYFAMGRDGVFFRALGRVHRTRRTPVAAILSQATLACLLIVTSMFTADPKRDVFDQLSNIVVFGGSVFYAPAVLAVVVLRFRKPELQRPYRTLGYPVAPLLFVGAYAWFLPVIVRERPVDSGLAVGVIAAGIPAFYIWNRRRSSSS